MPSKAFIKVSLAAVFFRADLCFAALSKPSTRLQKICDVCLFCVHSKPSGNKRKSVCVRWKQPFVISLPGCAEFLAALISVGWDKNRFLNFHQMEKTCCYWCESLLLIPICFWMVLAKKRVQFKGCVWSPYSLTHYSDSVEGSRKMSWDFLVFPELWDPSSMAVQGLQFLKLLCPFQPLGFPIPGFNSKSPWRALGFNRFLWHFSPSPQGLAGGVWAGESQ